MALLELLDKPIAYHRIFVKLTKSVTAAVMLSQAFYWSKRTTEKDGSFYKTQKEWEEETGLTRSEQETARKILLKTGFWEETLAGQPAKLCYRLDLKALEQLITNLESIR